MWTELVAVAGVPLQLSLWRNLTGLAAQFPSPLLEIHCYHCPQHQHLEALRPRQQADWRSSEMHNIAEHDNRGA